MPEKWTGEIVAKMHVNGITRKDVAEEMNVSKGYVSMLLNGKRTPHDAKERLEIAIDAIVDGKEMSG